MLVVLCYVLTHKSTKASTLSIASGTIQPRFATGTAQSVASHLTVTSHDFQKRFWSNIHVTLHGQQFTFYCFPAKILWMQMWTKPSFPLPYLHLEVNAEAIVLGSWWHWRKVFRLYKTWLPSDESAATSLIYLVCHSMHLCTGIVVLLLLRLICQRL